jgi:hypothetical protein
LASCQAHYERTCAIISVARPDADNVRKEISTHARTSEAKCPLNFYKAEFQTGQSLIPRDV